MEYKNVKLVGTGVFLPGDPIPINKIHDILGHLDKAPKKIQKWLNRLETVMNDILEVDFYHYAIDPYTKGFTEDNVSMSVKAAKKALESANMKAEDVEILIYGAVYMHQMPTPSVRIQEALGISKCAELSIHSNCTSAYKGLLIAHEFIKNGRYKNALIVSSQMTSAQLRAEFFNQSLLTKEDIFLRYYLCDGAGAFVLKGYDDKKGGVFLEETYMESAGGKKVSAMKTNYPGYFISPKIIYDNGCHHMKQLFQDELHNHFNEQDGTVFYHGLKRMIETNNINLEKLKYFQINMPSKHVVDLIMDECEKLGISKNKVYTAINKMGYPGPPAVFISIDKLLKEEKLENEDLILSFVTEVSKFMQAGFTLRYFD